MAAPATLPPQRAGAPTVGPGRWLAATALLSYVVLVLVLLGGKGAPQPVPAGLPDEGAVTGWLLPASRLLADLSAIASIGLLLAAAVLLPSRNDELRGVRLRAQRLVTWVALVWAADVVLEFALTVSSLQGQPVGDVLHLTVLRSYLVHIPEGRAFLVQVTLALVLAVACRWVLRASGAAVLLVVAVAALVPPLLTGHSAAAGNHDLAESSLMVHVVAAALWVGGLGGLAWAGAAGGKGLRLAVPRYSRLALWCFVAVAVSGVVNAGVRLGDVGPLVTSAYGFLVLGKVGALGVLAVFGWLHRRRTVRELASVAPDDAPALRDRVRLFVTVAATELVVMSATVALAVGLSRTPTPVRVGPDPGQAADLLGFPLPGRPTAVRLLTGFVPDGFALTFLALAASLYVTGLLVLRRRGVRWPVGRTIAWFTGLAVVGYATCGGLGLYAQVMFSAHMFAHMVLSMIAPIPLVLGAPLTLALRTLPGGRVPGERGPRQLLTAVLHSRVVRLVTHPAVAFALFVGSLYALYFTGLFPLLMSSHLGHVAMELHFLTVGSLFFWVLVGIDPAPRRLPPIARVGVLFLAMPFHAFFSIALMSSTTVLGGAYYHRLDRPYATDLLDDQHLGGGLGWALGEVPILLVLAAVFLQWVRADEREARRHDRALDRAEARLAGDRGDDEFAEYNAYLASLAADPHSRRP